MVTLTQPTHSIEGYVYGDRSSEDCIAVCLMINTNGREVPHNREIHGGLYQKFKSQGILYEDAAFRLDFYEDKRIEVVPIEVKVQGKLELDDSLLRLKEIEDAELERILKVFEPFDATKKKR